MSDSCASAYWLSSDGDNDEPALSETSSHNNHNHHLRNTHKNATNGNGTEQKSETRVDSDKHSAQCETSVNAAVVNTHKTSGKKRSHQDVELTYSAIQKKKRRLNHNHTSSSSSPTASPSQTTQHSQSAIPFDASMLENIQSILAARVIHSDHEHEVTCNCCGHSYVQTHADDLKLTDYWYCDGCIVGNDNVLQVLTRIRECVDYQSTWIVQIFGNNEQQWKSAKITGIQLDRNSSSKMEVDRKQTDDEQHSATKCSSSSSNTLLSVVYLESGHAGVINVDDDAIILRFITSGTDRRGVCHIFEQRSVNNNANGTDMDMDMDTDEKQSISSSSTVTVTEHDNNKQPQAQAQKNEVRARKTNTQYFNKNDESMLQFLVKYKDESYLHCRWLSYAQLVKSVDEYLAQRKQQQQQQKQKQKTEADKQNSNGVVDDDEATDSTADAAGNRASDDEATSDDDDDDDEEEEVPVVYDEDGYVVDMEHGGGGSGDVGKIKKKSRSKMVRKGSESALQLHERKKHKMREKRKRSKRQRGGERRRGMEKDDEEDADATTTKFKIGVVEFPESSQNTMKLQSTSVDLTSSPHFGSQFRSLTSSSAVNVIHSADDLLENEEKEYEYEEKQQSLSQHEKHGHHHERHGGREKRRKSHNRHSMASSRSSSSSVRKHSRDRHNISSMRFSANARTLQNSSFLLHRSAQQVWDTSMVRQCRITLSRNLRGFRFSNAISRAERRRLESMLSACLAECDEGPLKGRYKAYSQLNARKLPFLIETDKLFPKPDAPALVMAGYARDWPEARGVFINHRKNLYVWCNYLEHLHLIATQEDGNIVAAFKRLFDAEQRLEMLLARKQQSVIETLKQRKQQILQRISSTSDKDKDKDKDTQTPTMGTTISLVAFTPDGGGAAGGGENDGDEKTFTQMMVQHAEQKQDQQQPKRSSGKQQQQRLTKQEYRIKKLDVDAMQTGFVYDDDVGYVSSNPQYFGTSMRVYVTVKLPNLLKHDKFNDILEIRNLTAYQYDIDSAQQMFLAYSSQLPSTEQVRERRNSLNNVHVESSSSSTAQLPKLSKIKNSATSFTAADALSAEAAVDVDVVDVDQSLPRFSPSLSATVSDQSQQQRRSLKHKKPKQKKRDSTTTMLTKTSTNDEDLKINSLMSTLNLPDTSATSTTSNSMNLNEKRVSLKTLTDSMQKPGWQKQKSDSEAVTTTTAPTGRGVDDEDLNELVEPRFHREEVTIYQTVSLGVSEVEQVQSIVEAINYLIEMEKLLSAGNKLDERIKAEKLKKTKNKNKR